MIKKIIQKIRCSIPFSFDYFGHKNIEVVRTLSAQSQLIRCKDCGKLFAINHDVRVLLPWEDVKAHYEFIDGCFKKPCFPEKHRLKTCRRN